MKPSQSTVASVGIGVPTATILAWAIQTFTGVDVPGPVESAMGVLVGSVIGYFFLGGQAADTED